MKHTNLGRALLKRAIVFCACCVGTGGSLSAFPVEIPGVDTVEGAVTLVYDVECVGETTEEMKEKVSRVMHEYVDDVFNRLSVHSFLPARSGYDSARTAVAYLADGLSMRRFLTRELDWKEGEEGTLIRQESERETTVDENGETSRSASSSFVTRQSTAPRLRKVSLMAVRPESDADRSALYHALDDELESILNSVSTLVPSLQNQERVSLESYKKARAVGQIGAGSELPKIRQAKKEAASLRRFVKEQRSKLKDNMAEKNCNILGVIRNILKAKTKLVTLSQTTRSAR